MLTNKGFSLLESMASMVILLIIFAAMMTGMNQLMSMQGTVKNRTEMHADVRNATELLQQEIGQAGRIALPAAVTTTAATAAGAATAAVSSTSGMFANMYLDVDTGASFETVQATGISANGFAATFTFAHSNGTQVLVSGSFGTGMVPPAAAPSSYSHGSTDSVLKLYGDVNKDGKVLYVEYTCSPGTTSSPGYLYRNEISFTAASKPATSSSIVLMNNLLPNPNSVPCFSYQTATGLSGNTYIVDVGVTLTVQSQLQDPKTHQFQQETKALLNVSPRNIFEAWELDNAGSLQRIQPMPASVTALLP
ncbi:MAG TPA: type II secretion system protein [Terriglobia bacterium]